MHIWQTTLNPSPQVKIRGVVKKHGVMLCMQVNAQTLFLLTYGAKRMCKYIFHTVNTAEVNVFSPLVTSDTFCNVGTKINAKR